MWGGYTEVVRTCREMWGGYTEVVRTCEKCGEATLRWLGHVRNVGRLY